MKDKRCYICDGVFTYWQYSHINLLLGDKVVEDISVCFSCLKGELINGKEPKLEMVHSSNLWKIKGAKVNNPILPKGKGNQ